MRQAQMSALDAMTYAHELYCSISSESTIEVAILKFSFFGMPRVETVHNSSAREYSHVRSSMVGCVELLPFSVRFQRRSTRSKPHCVRTSTNQGSISAGYKKDASANEAARNHICIPEQTQQTARKEAVKRDQQQQESIVLRQKQQQIKQQRWSRCAEMGCSPRYDTHHEEESEHKNGL